MKKFTIEYKGYSTEFMTYEENLTLVWETRDEDGDYIKHQDAKSIFEWIKGFKNAVDKIWEEKAGAKQKLQCIAADVFGTSFFGIKEEE